MLAQLHRPVPVPQGQPPTGKGSQTPLHGAHPAVAHGSLPARRTHLKASSVNDIRSRAYVALALLILVTVAFAGTTYLWPDNTVVADRTDQTTTSPPLPAMTPALKVTHTYWRESYGVYHHYYTDPATGRMIDGGTVTVEELLKQGIDVPGFEVVAKPRQTPSDQLVERFKAIGAELRK